MTRVLEGAGPQAEWRVTTDSGQLVGLVLQEPTQRGQNAGTAAYTAVHSPSGDPREAWWRSAGHPTPQRALAALADHLAGEG